MFTHHRSAMQKYGQWRLFVWISLLCLLLASCAQVPDLRARRQIADSLAQEQDWQARTLSAGAFSLISYQPVKIVSTDLLTVYIEGDGLAWINSDQPSSNPTPLHPVGLQLALAQPDGQAVYLGRPCQYVEQHSGGCEQRYWTQQRFAPAVVTATNLALQELKQQYGAHRLQLVGYSGGAAIALLTAVRRNDVVRVITVAGNLDPVAWTDYHHVAPLRGSLNPADEIAALRTLPQWHFVGADDSVIPPALVQDVVQRIKASVSTAEQLQAQEQPAQIEVRTVPGFTHQCCWARDWATLWHQISAPSLAR